MRLSHLTAVATLAALITGLLVAMTSVSAQANDGVSLGNCFAWDASTPLFAETNYVSVGDSCQVDLAENQGLNSSNEAVIGSVEADVAARSDHEVEAQAVGLTHLTIVDADGEQVANSAEYRIQVIARPTLIVHIGDTDNIVSSDDDAPSVTVIARGFESTRVPATDATNITVSVNGLFFRGALNATSFISAVGDANDPDAASGGTLTAADTDIHILGRSYTTSLPLVIAGASDNDYKITATVAAIADDDGTTEIDESRKAVRGESILTISDPGSSPASAVLALGNERSDNPTTIADETIPETDSAPAGSTITLVYAISNSLGNDANGGDLSTVQVVAPLGEVTDLGLTKTRTSASSGFSAKGAVTIGSKDDEPRTIDVYVYATGDGGVATSEILTLSFTGGTDAIELAGPSDSLHDEATKTAENNDRRDTIAFVLSTLDSAGNEIENQTNLVYRITGPDGKPVSTKNRIVPLQTTLPTSVEDSNDLILLTSQGGASNPLAKGEYTLKVTSGASSVETMFLVADEAETIDIEVDEPAPDTVGQVITATITVTDENGVNVADDTVLTVLASDVAAGSDRVLVRTSSETVKTKAGVAEATFAVVGNGSSVITASVGGASGVKVIISTAGAVEPEAMPEEEASVACLSNLAGFTTWSCGVESSASEIFELVSGRGATALHLWNGSAWVRYSVVDGAMVPGSSDFMVTQYDNLYISN